MNLQDAYYEQKFEVEFLRAKGDAFQSFFERLMGLVYKADFMACRPWGNQGDRKNDGFLKSERRLFQVYAPNQMDAAKAKAKITEDFAGAREHWGKHFDAWTFVKASWFGLALTDATRIKLGFGDLKVVLERIAALPAPPMTEVKDVPTGKIEANALSEAVARLLKEGMIKSPLVAEFLAQWHDETLGERLAEAFKAEYRRLRGSDGPNWIFTALQSWVGGDHRGTPEHELAVLAIIAYYFERCDIFEEPRRAAR